MATTSDATIGGLAAGLLSDHQRPTSIHYRILWLCFLAWIFDFYDLILFAFLLVPIAHDLGLTRMQSSVALGFSFLMAAIGGVSFGFIGDRFGRRPVMIATVAIYGGGTLLCAAATSYPFLLFGRAIAGAFGGVAGANVLAIVGDVFPHSRRGRAMGVIMSAFSIASIAGVPLALHLTELHGRRAPFAEPGRIAIGLGEAVNHGLGAGTAGDLHRQRQAGGGKAGRYRDRRRASVYRASLE